MSNWFKLMTAVAIGYLFGLALAYLLGRLIDWINLYLHPMRMLFG
jgi:NhaP-type Na+/H+ or K+/H+ antiporter